MDNQNIKEILEELNKFPYGKFYGLRQEQVNQINQLLDYITNLQTIEREYSSILSENAELEQKYDMALEDNARESHRRMELQEENERLNQNNQAMQEEMARTWKIADDYKSRIDKAIEYNKNILKESWYGGNEKKYAKTNLEILGDKE